jgi:Gram-negative bacterial TonB protein C-terminal
VQDTGQPGYSRGVLTLTFSLLLASQAPVSSCGVSDDPAFATTKEHAAQVGGGAMYAAARERRYLDALRGPNGEPLTYKRRGSLPLDTNAVTILDVYEVTYPGIAQTAVLYLDAYHFDDALVAPKGFLCAVSIALAPPGPDAFQAMDAIRAVALEQGATKTFAPISLDADGSAAHGILLDSFRLMVHVARAAAAAGEKIDANNVRRDLLRVRMVIVAYPQRCGDKDAIAPASVELAAANGPAPPRDGELATGEALARLLPGMTLPAGSMAAVYQLDRPRVTDTVRIAYPDAACREVVLPFKYTNGRPLNTPPAQLPAGQSPTDRSVRIQAVIDLDGAVQQPRYVGGPAALAEAAIAAVRGWTAEPVRLNGAPLPTPVILPVKFR